MATFLFILKIIGIIIAVILGLLIFLVCLGLFVPIRYKIQLNCQENISVTIKVSWLLKLVRVFVCYDQDTFTYTVKLLFFKLPMGQEQQPPHGESEAKTAPNPEPDLEPDFSKEAAVLPDDSKTNAEIPIEKKASSDAKAKKKKRSPKAKDTGKTSLKEVLSKIKAFFTDEANRDSISSVWRIVKKLLVHMSPKRAVGELFFSLGTPDLTGKVLGVISLMPFVYGKKMKIRPDFEADEPYIQGHVAAIGRIQMYVIVWAAISLYKDKNIRRAMKQLKN